MAPTIELGLSVGTADIVSRHLRAATAAKAAANFKLRILSKRDIDARAARWDPRGPTSCPQPHGPAPSITIPAPSITLQLLNSLPPMAVGFGAC